ncbi:MAG: YncE family protein [Anaerolineae bacterium]
MRLPRSVCLLVAIILPSLLFATAVHAQSPVDTIALRPPAGNGLSPVNVAVHAALNRIYTVNAHTANISVIDGHSQRVTAVIPVGGAPSGMALNPDTNRLYVTSLAENNVYVIDTTTNAVLRTLEVGDNPLDIAVDVATNRLYVTNSYNRITVIDGGDYAVLAEIYLDGPPTKLAVNGATKRVYALTHSLVVIDATDNTVVTKIPLGPWPRSLTVDASSNRIYAAAGSDLFVVDGENNNLLTTIPVGYDTAGMEVLDGYLYLTDPVVDEIKIIVTTDNQVVDRIEVPENPYSLAVNPNRNLLYLGHQSTSLLSILDVETKKTDGTILLGSLPEAVVAHPVTKRLYVANPAANMVLVVEKDRMTGQIDVPVQHMAIDAATNRLYTAREKTLYAVDLATNDIVGQVSFPHRVVALAADTATDHLYLVTMESISKYGRRIRLSAVEGATNEVIETVVLGDVSHISPRTAIAVNGRTKRIYVSSVDILWIIVSTTLDTIAKVDLTYQSAWALAVDLDLDRLYLTKGDGLRVLDGNRNRLVAQIIDLPTWEVAINPDRHHLYLTGGYQGGVVVIDGATYQVRALLSEPRSPAGVAHLEDRFYVSERDQGLLYVFQDAPTPSLGTTWYFAEGATVEPFDTWLLLQNPGDDPALVTAGFMMEDGSQVVRAYTLPPASRTSIWVDRMLPKVALSSKVLADGLVLAERAMYFNHDGHASIGAKEPSPTWYFAEGFSGPTFDTWILLQNPNDRPTDVTLTFMKEDGSKVVRQLELEPTSRLNVWADQIVPNVAFGTVVQAGQPIVAERAMYFGEGGGHGQLGVTAPRQEWYFAEGFTGPGYDTWLLLLNPGDQAAQVTVSFIKDDGGVVSRQFTVGPTSRLNVWADLIVPNQSFGMMVRSDEPIVAERTMYFGRGGGHNSIGAVTLAKTWYFPEGSTRYPFTEFLLLANPGPATAEITVAFMGPELEPLTRHYILGPTSRLTIPVNGIVPNSNVSLNVNSDQPIVAERAMYFQEGNGGTVSLGIAQ